jgi:regulator of protease activity HflC (stomatin/prohibitin superfamily)
MWLIVLIFGVILAAAIVFTAFRLPGTGMRERLGGIVLAAIVLVVAFAASSIRLVGANEVGIVVKNVLGAKLDSGKIIAAEGQMGIQAEVLSPGWHFWYWPGIYDVRAVPLTEIKSDEVGLIETTDGVAMGEGDLFAAEWSREEFQSMLDAQHFLTTGKGKKGKQVSVLTPGKYRLNTELYRIKSVPQTEVLAGEVAVLKANFGSGEPSIDVKGVVAAGGQAMKLAKLGERGIRADVLAPAKYPLNTDAFTVTEIWTTKMTAHFTRATAMTSEPNRDPKLNQTQNALSRMHDSSMEEREITVRTSDGFTFPVDVRVEYVVEPQNAPIVVSRLGDDEGERFRNAMNSAVRAIFRNNAEGVRALDYVQQRSHQESQSLKMLKDEMSPLGVTVTAVRIGSVGDEATLGELLKTQTEREIAKQQEVTLQEKQKAAERQKELARTTQEAEEEKRLATAAYAVKIAEEDKRKALIAAAAEAESIKVRAEAQAQAYRLIATQIGPANSAMLEMLKIVGASNIQITPRVMINNSAGSGPGTGTGGGGGGGGSGAMGAGETTALIGTMLDQLVSRDDMPAAVKPASGGTSAPAPTKDGN